MVSLPPWVPVTQVGVLAAIASAIGVVRWLDRRRDWGTVRRRRLLLGVPWGTLVSAGIVLGVYLVVQGGVAHWNEPVVVAFRSWSYLYPTGTVLASFAHSGPNHLVGNLVGALVLGSLAEFAWGHYPRSRGTSTFSGPWTNPYVRAFLAVPVVVGVGLVSSLLSWGPVIGFSGVVFAMAGFAFVRYPIWTVVALEVDDVVGLLYRVLQEPVLTARARPQLVEPWWAGIAIQGHLLGLLLGVLIGAVAVPRREHPDARRHFAGAVLLGVGFSLWALWWFRGGTEYVLYRGVGLALVFVLAAALTAGLRGVASEARTLADVPLRQVGLLVLVFPVLVLGFAAVPLNLSTVDDAGVPDDPAATIDVRDYAVTYAENITNGQTSVVNVTVLGETTRLNTSGVIVVSRERHIWTTAVSKARLAFAGSVRVPLGGIGWRETVEVRREGWTVPSNGSVYRVSIRDPPGAWRTAYRSGPAVAEPVVAGRTVAVRAAGDGFVLEVRQNATAVATAPLPEPNASVSAGGLGFERREGAVVAVHNDTRVRIASVETYSGAEVQSMR